MSNSFSNPFLEQGPNITSSNGKPNDIDLDRAAEDALLQRYGLNAEHLSPQLETSGHPGTAAVNGVKVSMDRGLS